MRYLSATKLIPIAGVLLLLLLTFGTALAHERRDVGGYQFVVGFLVEPAYEGLKNGLDLRVTSTAETSMNTETNVNVEEHGAVFASTGVAAGDTFSFEVPTAYDGKTIPYHNHMNHDLTGSITVSDTAQLSGTVDIDIHDDGFHPAEVTVKPGTTLVWTNQTSTMQMPTSGLPPEPGHTHEEAPMAVPVEGLEKTLQVEMTHVASNTTKTLPLRTIFNDPGHYTADLIPTAPGVYQFRVFGTVEGTEVDETFVSQGGGGGFGDVESSADLQFPQQLPEIREIEAAVKGTQNNVQGAQDAALDASDSASSAKTLAIVGIVLGALGVAAGAGSVALALRKR